MSYYTDFIKNKKFTIQRYSNYIFISNVKPKRDNLSNEWYISAFERYISPNEWTKKSIRFL